MTRLLRVSATVAVLGALTLALAAPVAARGPDPDRLQGQGWFCIDIAPLGLHCDNPGVAKHTATEAQWLRTVAWPELVFDAATGEFWGTEIGIRDDIWRPRPCPRDGGLWYADVGHMFCHHYPTQ